MKKIVEWILSVVAALIMLQTLYFKFTAHPESVFIFSELGMEPAGRIGSGMVELIAGVFLFIPRLRVYGAILGMGVMAGAIFFHLARLGVEVKGDGGQLFIYALVTFTSCLLVTILRRKEIPVIGKNFL